jgi:hypothetical protein
MWAKWFIYFCVIYFITGCNKKSNAPSTPPDKTTEYFVAPSETDPSINIALENHFVSVKETGSLKNILFVFLPGSYSQPSKYKAIVRKAASMGYHSIGLMYPNLKPVNNICSPTNDTTCHRRARLEIIDGQDRHPEISVNQANSIVNRLTKLLIHLQKNYPDQNWQQFLSNGNPDWPRIIVSGHSQGAANADVMGKVYPVKKIIMFSVMDFLSNRKIPDWENMPANREKYFSLFNPSDELIDYTNAKNGWKALGMLNYGEITNVDSVNYPYSGSHTLITRITPVTSLSDKFHNSTVVDTFLTKDNSGNFVLDKVWEYLLSD